MTRWASEVALMLSARFDVAIVAKATLILVLGLATTPLARRARASVRHLILAATFGTVSVHFVAGYPKVPSRHGQP